MPHQNIKKLYILMSFLFSHWEIFGDPVALGGDHWTGDSSIDKDTKSPLLTS